MRALLVVNPVASTCTPALRATATRVLRRTLKLDVEETQGSGDAGLLARQAAEDGVDLVLALGGDGTLNEVVNGVLGDDGPHPGLPAVGIVPGGSTNVFARSLGLPGQPVAAVHALVQAVREGRQRRVSLGRVDDRWFTFTAGLGYDADVVRCVEEHRARGREATTGRYVRSALVQFFRDAERHVPAMTLEVPGRDPITGVHLAVVANTSPWTYLGPYAVDLVPHASLDTGLDVLGMQSLAAPVVLRHVVQGLLGRPIQGPRIAQAHDVETLRVHASRPTALQVDGEYLGMRTSVRLENVPRAIALVA